jgi:hypothetical protein
MMKPRRRALVGAPNPDPKSEKDRLDSSIEYPVAAATITTPRPVRGRLSVLTNWLYALPVLNGIWRGSGPEAARIQKLFPRRELNQPTVDQVNVAITNIYRCTICENA